MKHAAPFLIMRYDPPLGRGDRARRVSVAYYADTVDEALTVAAQWHRFRVRHCFWIVRRHAAAHRRRVTRPM